MSAYSMPHSVLRASHALTIFIEQSSQADMCSTCRILPLYQSPMLNHYDMWKTNHTFNKIHTEFMEVIFVITVPSKYSCFLTLFVLITQLSTKLPWRPTSYLTPFHITHKHKKKSSLYWNRFYWFNLMIKIIFHQFDKSQNHLILLRYFSK